MNRYLAIGLLAAVAMLVLGGPCLADEIKAVDEDKLTGTEDEVSLKQVHTLCRWACVLAGLALAGVLWVGWSMQTLARNQVQLGKLIQSHASQKGG